MNDLNATSARRSGAAIMGRLIVLVKPLVPIMVLAILLGSVGYLCAIFITILAAFGISAGLEGAFAGASFSSEALVDMPVAGPVGVPVLFVALAVMAVARGLLHYGEQYCNHFIAFRLLAIVRHRVFAVLRTLCPAKLEGRDKGDLVSLITSDIELLEVFYAHTISPIAIAVIVSACMAAFISTQSAAVSLVALAGYTVVGVLIPIAHGRRGAQVGFVAGGAGDGDGLRVMHAVAEGFASGLDAEVFERQHALIGEGDQGQHRADEALFVVAPAHPLGNRQVVADVAEEVGQERFERLAGLFAVIHQPLAFRCVFNGKGGDVHPAGSGEAERGFAPVAILVFGGGERRAFALNFLVALAGGEVADAPGEAARRGERFDVAMCETGVCERLRPEVASGVGKGGNGFGRQFFDADFD